MLTVVDTSAQIFSLRVVNVRFLRGNGRDLFFCYIKAVVAIFGLGGGDLRLVTYGSRPFVYALLEALSALLLVVINETRQDLH